MCSIDYADDIYCDFFTSRTPVARKNHQCCECGRLINKGEKYHYSTGSWDGCFDTFKHCRHCDTGAKLLSRYCRGYIFETIQEDLSEHIHPSIPWSIKAARVLIGMRRQWKRFDGSGLMLEVANNA